MIAPLTRWRFAALSALLAPPDSPKRHINPAGRHWWALTFRRLAARGLCIFTEERVQTEHYGSYRWRAVITPAGRKALRAYLRSKQRAA